MGSVCKFQRGPADDLTGRLGAEPNRFEMLGRNNGQLLDDKPVQVLPLNLLARDVVERDRVEIGEQGRKLPS